MDRTLPKLYKDYGDYSNYRNFPLDVDGLKPVERRVLLAAYKIARNKLAKCRQVDTYTCGHYHPHGECYGTIVQLVRQGFLDGQGNFGTNIGVEPVGAAAPRYTECRISPSTIDLSFKYVNYVPWLDTELEDKEPFHLPTMYPICLLGNDYTQGIGFGYKTYIPCYEIGDLCKRLFWLLGVRKTKPTIQPITNCRITATPSDLEQLLTTGKAKIDVEGVIDVNTLNNTVKLKSWPPGKRFQTILNKFSKELSENMIGFSDLSVRETEIVFQVMRERNRDKIFREFVEKLKGILKGAISFEMTTVDINQRVTLRSVDDMLINTFNMFTAVNDEMLKVEIAKTEGEIEWLNTIELIVPTLSECLKNGYDVETSLEIIEKETPVTKKVAEELINKYRIRKLLTFDTDNTQLKNKLDELKTYSENLTDYVLGQYKEL